MTNSVPHIEFGRVSDFEMTFLLREFYSNCKKRGECNSAFSLSEYCLEFEQVDSPKERFKVLLCLIPNFLFV